MQLPELTIREVTSKADWKQFLQIPWQLYKDDPLWVPPLLFDLKRQLNKKCNPFFREADAKYWIAFSGDKCVGRIAAIINHQHNEFYGESTGFFGFFECMNDGRVAGILLDTAHGWLLQNKMKEVRGPVNLSLNNECGFLVDGFDRSPVLQMNYNHRYYPVLLEAYGYEKEHDLLAYYITDKIFSNDRVMKRLERITELVTKKEHIQFRNFKPSDLNAEVQRVRTLFNDYMAENWGFLPMTESECAFMAESLKPVLVKDLAIFAEINGEPIGSSLALPDLNYVVKKMNGKLFPFGIFKFLFYKRKIKDIRVMLMGLSKPYRKKGLEAVFIYKTILECFKRNITGAELSWISEDNIVLINELEKMDAELYKRYRIYSMPLVKNIARKITEPQYGQASTII